MTWIIYQACVKEQQQDLSFAFMPGGNCKTQIYQPLVTEAGLSPVLVTNFFFKGANL